MVILTDREIESPKVVFLRIRKDPLRVLRKIDHSIYDEEIANWEELPQVILELIVRRLATEEFLATRQVCTSWRTTAAKETYNAKSKAPWLMIYAYNRRAEFSNPSTGRIYPVQLPRSYCQTLSTPGWILVANGYSEHRIANPLSCISIELPALEKLQHELHHIHMIDLSRSISLSRYSVMTSYAASPGLGFVFLRSGEDAWAVVIRAMPMPGCTVLQLICYHGLFVALDSESQIMTLNEKKSRMESRLILGLNFYDDGILVSLNVLAHC